MKTIKLTYHSGSANHGCEAIVRSINKIFNESNYKLELYSFHTWEDYDAGLDKIVNIYEYNEIQNRPKLIRFIERKIRNFLGEDDIIYNKQLLYNNDNSIVFSIGGDNYSEYNFSIKIAKLHSNIKLSGQKTVLFGCSIEPDLLIYNDIIQDLKKYDIILVRESLTFNALISKELTNVRFVPDPAFILDKIELPFPVTINKKLIGINISPLILNKAKNNEIILKNYINLMIYLLEKKYYKIMLISHVTTDYSDDRIAINKLYQYFNQNKNVFKITAGNCMELKGYISRCALFVCARTHASIAAYSSCVPTLVVGYSIKSKGIAKDLFGTDDHYVLSVNRINNDNELLEEFKWLEINKQRIRSHLTSIMPKYSTKAYDAKEIIESLREEFAYEKNN